MGSRQRPQSRAMRAVLSPARPAWLKTEAATGSARWAVCSEKTLGSPGSPTTRTTSGDRKCSRSPQSIRTSRARPRPYRAAELPRRRQRGQCPRGGQPLAWAGWPRAPAEWSGLAADHPLASDRCPRACPPPAASARGQVHAGGAAVAASIRSLHSHRPAPRRAPGRWSFGGLSY